MKAICAGMVVLATCVLVSQGRERPARIVSTSPSTTEMLFALGLGDQVVGVSEFCRYPPVVATLPKVGSVLHPDLERIVTLRPDLVAISDLNADLAGRLDATQIPYVAVTTTRLSDVSSAMMRIGIAAGVESHARAVVANMQARLETIRQRASGGRRPRVLLVVGRAPDSLTGIIAAGGGSYLNDLVDIAGGSNVAASWSVLPYPQMSLESILRLNPEVIVDTIDMSLTEAQRRRRIADSAALWGQYRTLSAVRSGRVHTLGTDALFTPGPRVVDVAAWLADLNPAAEDTVTAKPIFVGGTSSNAGKSWMATAICAWLRARGVAVAPFKAQTMSNNSYPCAHGGEIGRAQVAQAEACGLEPEPAMNPILLKPNGGESSQVIVNGRVWKTVRPREYDELTRELRPYVEAAYGELARRYEVVVIEGAGSVTELNLRAVDLANLGLVTQLRAPWILVADIERGGVFASIVGTMALLSREERALFRGFAINKFRGDISLFDEGVRILEARTSAPCLGVFPFAPDITLDAEDSLALNTCPRRAAPAGARIAIVHFPCVSNATDFRLLDWAEWIVAPSSDDFDFVILPGSKRTIADLRWLRDVGLADWVGGQHRRGATVVGVCGGFQMMGRRVCDPGRVESPDGEAEGLGLLPGETILESSKTTALRTARSRGGVRFHGYKIHLGATRIDPPATPFAHLDDGRPDGACAPGVIGTYLHGAFENAEVCAETFGVEVAAVSKADQYRRLGEWFARNASHLDVLKL